MALLPQDKLILGLCKLGNYLQNYLTIDSNTPETYEDINFILKKSEIDNAWFTFENQKFALEKWANLFTEDNLKNWLKNYHWTNSPKNVGLVLAGNLPLVGFHDILSVILSGHHAVVKLSSKDRLLIPFLLKKWDEFSEEKVRYSLVEKLTDFDAVIAAGSNNTARYLEFYFKNKKNIIRKNRTSIAVLDGQESNEELQKLAEDIFTYFGLGCRNVTRLMLPKNFELNRLFENFIHFKEVINHHKYANNYDYNRAIYLLDQNEFWDNNFVLLKEDDALFSPLAVINFSRYDSLEDVKYFIHQNEQEIQCIVASSRMSIENSIPFGKAQNPSLDTYADNIDTMKFLENL